MVNWTRIGFLIALLAFGVAGCKKANDAGNDSMSASGSKIEASDGAKASGP